MLRGQVRIGFFPHGWDTFFQFEIPHLYLAHECLGHDCELDGTTPEYKRQGSDASEALPLALKLFRI